MKNRNLIHTDNWITPAWFYEKLNKEFDFDFDPCPFNDQEIKWDVDGLLIEWGERNFINPPYSRNLKEAFIQKAIAKSKEGKLCVMLLPVSTSTKIFHKLIKPNAKEIRFIEGRIKFQKMDAQGKLYTPKNGGMHDSMIVIFDERK